MSVTLRTRKFIRNPLLKRRQMIVEVVHPGAAGCSKKDISEKLAEKFKAKADSIVVFGFQSKFGGGRTTGFALVYDNADAMKKFEPRYRLKRLGLWERPTHFSGAENRKGIKEAKNRQKKIRGTGRSIAKKKAKRSAE
jgi:small subunit ribosomal protein S24e